MTAAVERLIVELGAAALSIAYLVVNLAKAAYLIDGTVELLSARLVVRIRHVDRHCRDENENEQQRNE
jgi:hypothetical protein